MTSLRFIYVDITISRYHSRVIVNSLFLSHRRRDYCIFRVILSHITTRITSHIIFFSLIIIILVDSKNSSTAIIFF